MACCIALAMLIAFVRGAWALIPLPGRRHKQPQDFAPAAHRPAPAPTQPVASEQVRVIARTSSDASVVVGA